MKLRNILPAATAMALAMGLSVPAQAGYTIVDGWQLLTPGNGLTTNIGHLDLISGGAAVTQEIDGSGNIFTGAKFSETGQILSISYTKENSVGLGDNGSVGVFSKMLTLSFSAVTGVIGAPAGTGFSYSFNSGSFTISEAGTGTLVSSGSIVGIGGTIASTNVVGGFTGTSTILGEILASVAGFDIKDSTGTSLLPKLATGEALVQAITTNNFTPPLGGLTPGACPFASTTGICATFDPVSSQGQLDIAVVPEPSSVALVGLALFGVGAASRRASKAKKA